MKIEFGCGSKPTDGFLGCDIRALPNVNFVCNAWEIVDYVDPNTVEEIKSRHFLEHLTPLQADKTLMAWHIVLELGGRIVTEVPDLEYHCRQFLDKKNRRHQSELNGPKTHIQHAMAGFYGWQHEINEGEMWDLHKWGYDYDLLAALLKRHDFRDIKRIKTRKRWNLVVEAYK